MVAKRQLFNQKLWLSVPIITAGAFIYFGSTVLAQVKPDRTLGKESSVVTPVNPKVDRIDGGAVRGSNLFHSFKDFNVGEGRRVNFANPAGIDNILSRVTGGNASNILGTLGVLGNANLYLLNPNGIIFGPSARLDIRGSFVASTGKGITFEDRILYGVNNSGSKPLLTMAVPVGLQYGTQGGNISNAGNLKVGQGQKLALAGSTVTTSGKLIAPGGTVHVLGERVGLLDNAEIDVSGETAGGNVLIGRGSQGKGKVPNAKRTFVGSNVSINADALTSGDGGRVIVWADETTGFYGNISARGGNQSGDGGFAEVSGKQNLAFHGKVDVSASNGNLGTLLLDPENIRIIDADNAPDDGQLPNILFETDPGETHTISNTVLEQQNGNIVLEASENITVDDDLSLNFNASGGSIKFTADADNDGSGSFKMDSEASINASGRDIEISGASVELGDIDTSSDSANGGNVKIEASDIITSGVINTSVPSSLGGGANGAVVDIKSFNGSIKLIGQDGTGNSVIGKSITINTPSTIFVEGILNARNDVLDDTSEITIGNIFAPSSITVAAISTRNLEGLCGCNIGGGGNIYVRTTGSLNVTSAFSKIGKLNDSNAPNDISIASQAAGNGGKIDIIAGGDINIAKGIFSNSLKSGNGGDINLTSKNDAINIQAGTVDSSSTNGDGGIINLNAAGNITTNSILSNSSGNGKGGDITLTSDNGAINTSQGIIDSFSTSSNGGEIKFDATGNITTGSILSNSSSNGKGGNITLTSRNGKIDTSAGILNPSSGTGDLLSQNNENLLSQISVLSQQVSGLNTGNAGKVELNARGDISSGSIKSTGLKGGSITFNSNNKISLNKADIASINTGNFGKGSNIEFTAPIISLTDARVVSLSTGNIRAGDVIVKASEEVKINSEGSSSPNFIGVSPLFQSLKQQPDLRGTGFISTTFWGNGDTGNITIDTKKLSIHNKAELPKDNKNAPPQPNLVGVGTLTLPGSSYNAGDIIVNASESLEIIGNKKDRDFKATPANPEQAQKLAKEIQDIPTGITSATQGTGDAGSIIINTGELIIKDTAAITSGATNTSTGKRKEGGELTVNAASVVLEDKAALVTATRSSKDAAKLTINADTIKLGNGALISTDSTSSGSTGDLNINNASNIELDSNSRIGAGTYDTGQGGNITITVTNNIDFIGRDSEISSEALLENARGGNLEITAGNFIISSSISNNNDVIATSGGIGRGGQVTIVTKSHAGFLPLNKERTPDSDISAASSSGEDGTLSLITNNPQPQLPQQTSVREIIQVCPASQGVTTRAAGRSEYINTGHGGLPPNPNEALESNTAQIPWVTLNSEENQTTSAASSTLTNTSTPKVIREAQGWIKIPNGKLLLTTQNSNSSSLSCVFQTRQP